MAGLVEPAGDGFRSAMQARLMKSYMALPDMEHVKLAMDNWLGHQVSGRCRCATPARLAHRHLPSSSTPDPL